MIVRTPSLHHFRRGLSSGVFSRFQLSGFSPLKIPNLSTWYDISDLSSLRNNAGAVPSSGDGIKLVSDKSGNSPVNVLCLNGALNNYAHATVTLPVDGIELIARIMPGAWNPAANKTVQAQWNDTNGKFIWQLNTDKTLSFYFSTDGTALIAMTSTAALPFASSTVGVTGWIRVRFQANNGTQRQADFYYAADTGSNVEPTAWTQLGATVNVAGTSNLFNSTYRIMVGGNNTNGANPLDAVVRYASFKNLSGTTLAALTPATAAKLATSLTGGAAETWTVATSGDLGARISGERDLYQGTAAKQPVLTVSPSGNLMTFDGVDDYMKAAAWAMAQPVSFYGVLSQVSWTSGDYIIDGNAANTLALIQTTSTPQLNINAGSSVAANTGLAVATPAIVTIVSNGASSLLRINRGTATTGNAGAGVPNGITIGASATPGNYGNTTASEVLIYAAAHDTATQNRIIAYLGYKWGIAV